MKKLLSFLFVSLLAVACTSTPSYTKAENALDAGREFIDGCLKGEFKKADYFMLQDDANKQDLEKTQQAYLKKSNQEKVQYEQTSIIIDGVVEESDSVTIINYRNSVDKTARKLKVVKQGDTWKVDYKFGFDEKL